MFLVLLIAAANAAVYRTPPVPRTGIREMFSGQMLDTADAVSGCHCWVPNCGEWCRSCCGYA